MRRRRFAAPMAALIGLTLYACAFFPGAMSFDGAYQWWQARGGETSNVHAPALTWLWRASDALSTGPGALFVFQLALLWGGLALIAARLPASTFGRAAFVLAGGALPICWVLFSAVLSDALLAAVLCCAVGLLAMPPRARSWRLAGVLLALCAAVLLRKNAAPAVLPLLVVLFAQELRYRITANVVLACMATIAMQAGAAFAERFVDRHGSILPALALWDTAAISIDAGEVLLPAASHGPGLDVQDLAQAFEPFSCVSIFARTHAGLVQPFIVDGDPLSGSIRDAWLRAIAAHPGTYLAHRARLMRALFGSKQDDWPRELVFFLGEYQYRDNPPVAPNTSPLNRAWTGLMEATRSSLLFAAWPYVIAAILGIAMAWPRRREATAALALAVLGSGLLYALPLVFIAPSAELRYLGWPCLAAYLGCVLAMPSKWRRNGAADAAKSN